MVGGWWVDPCELPLLCVHALVVLIRAQWRMCSCCVLGWQAGLVLLLQLANGFYWPEFGIRSGVRCVWHMPIVTISPLK